MRESVSVSAVEQRLVAHGTFSLLITILLFPPVDRDAAQNKICFTANNVTRPNTTTACTATTTVRTVIFLFSIEKLASSFVWSSFLLYSTVVLSFAMPSPVFLSRT